LSGQDQESVTRVADNSETVERGRTPIPTPPKPPAPEPAKEGQKSDSGQEAKSAGETMEPHH
jgi:hypothetical protein